MASKLATDPPLQDTFGKNPNISVVGSEPCDISTTDAAPTGGVCRGIYIEVAGTVKADFADGSTDTLANVAAGMWHAMAVTKIYKVGTTATGIHFGH